MEYWCGMHNMEATRDSDSPKTGGHDQFRWRPRVLLRWKIWVATGVNGILVVSFYPDHLDGSLKV
ncbi:hypothetical protein T265_09993 [Opisthorchis viverrini]|uniref:Uncharacterized protein n=1 Tax=Opisthorchis viverrini TaxID=6198 RepID=A0A075A2Z4_OPIVI|nr:hypothetical protein T265_09993 [Opisthorchis viverrini]KER21754.1 hypothetical protein T265_09993 [Opisthorchis viverrini]